MIECALLGGHHHLGETCCLFLHSYTEDRGLGLSETLVVIILAVRCQNVEDQWS